MKRPYVILVPCGGLCNRMRAIVGGITIAKQVNAKKLIVLWEKDAACNIELNKIFEPLPFLMINYSPQRIGYRIKSIIKKLLNCAVLEQEEAYQLKQNEGVNSWLENNYGKNLFIQTFHNLSDSTDFSPFIFKDKIKRTLLHKMNSSTIGIHIRRSDNDWSIEHSPTSLFVSAMNKEIEENEYVNFFIASDSHKEIEYLKSIFHERIIAYPSLLDRNIEQGIIDASIELYHLSLCKKIYGSWRSSFSTTAGMLGHIPVIYCSNTEKPSED